LKIYAMYHPSKYKGGPGFTAEALALADLLGDWFFGCPTRRAARTISQHLAAEGSGKQVHLYRFTWRPQQSLMTLLGSFHGAEVPFVFNNLTDNPPLLSFSPSDSLLSSSMIDYWAGFAKTGDPNQGFAVPWPAHRKATDLHLVLDDAITQGQHLEQAQCDFWDTIGL